MSNPLICELICTRLSHDIVGNIGAVSNAVELLEEGDMDFIDDIKSILSVSPKTLSSRLKFFRMAFGLNNSNLENNEIVVKTENMFFVNKDLLNDRDSEYHRINCAKLLDINNPADKYIAFSSIAKRVKIEASLSYAMFSLQSKSGLS